MRRRRAVTWALGAGLWAGMFGCSANEVAVPPVSTEIQTIIALGKTDKVWSGTAREYVSPLRIEVTGEDLLVVGFVESLEALGLEAGPFLPLPEGPCALRNPAVVFTAPDGGEMYQGSASEAAEILLPGGAERCRVCPDFRMIDVPYGLESVRSHFAIESGDKIYVGGNRGVFQVDEARAVALPGCNRGYSFATPGPSGGLWALRANNLDLIDPGSANCTILSSLELPALGKNVTSSAQDRNRVYVATSSGALFQFRDGTLEELGTLDASEESRDGGLVWLGPDRVAYSHGLREVLFFDHGETRVVSVETPDNGLSALAETPAGLVAGNGQGDLFLYDGAQFRFFRTLARSRVGYLGSYGQRTLAALNSAVYVFGETGEVCSFDLPDTTTASPENLVVLGDTVLISDAYDSDGARAVWLVPQ